MTKSGTAKTDKNLKAYGQRIDQKTPNTWLSK